MTSNADPQDMRVVTELSPETQRAAERAKQITSGDNSYIVRVTYEFEVRVWDVDSEADARIIAEAAEMKLSPWSQDTASIDDEHLVIDEVELSEDDDDNHDPDGYDLRET